ncbi:unnamed protein product [Pylaiella littoralis]
MIRARSLATACVRECVRSLTAAGSSAANGGGARAAEAAVVVRALSERNSRSAQPPIGTATGSQVPSDDLDFIKPGHDRQGRDDPAEELGDLLRQHAWAREDWTGPLELSDYERVNLSKNLVRRIKDLRNANKLTKVGRAIEILNEGRRQGTKDLLVYEAVLQQLLSSCRVCEDGPENLEIILEKMREDGLQPDIKTYNYILDFHATVRNSQKAVAVYEEMLSKSIEPNQKTLSHVIVAHSRGDHDAMYRTVKELYARNWKGSRSAYLGMVAVMGQRSDDEGVLATMRRMRQESKKPTEAAFAKAFWAAENLGQVEMSKEIFKHRIEAGLPPQEYAYVKMMVMLMKHGRAEECLKYWRQLVCVNGLNGVVINPETYNFAIKCTCAVDNLDEMEAVLEMMESQGIVPTQKTYVAALSGLESPDDRDRIKGAARAFAAIAKTGIPPGATVLQRKAAAYAHAGMWQEAVDLFALVLEDKAQFSPRDWKCLMMAQFELGKFAEVRETWALSMQNRKTAHSYRAYDYALKAAKELKDPDWALRLREATREVDKVSIDLDRAAVETLLSSGRLEAARAILKEWETLALRVPSIRGFGGSYQLALAICEKRGDAKLALEFFDGMQSATPPFRPCVSCPSFMFVLESLKENGRVEELGAFFDDFCALAAQRAGEALPSPECYAFVTQARHDRGFSQSEEPAPYAGESKMDEDFTDDQYPELSPNTEGHGITCG